MHRYPQAVLLCVNQRLATRIPAKWFPNPKTAMPYAHDRFAMITSSHIDWNTCNEFFIFTRGRFVLDEAENLCKRTVRFDMNELARIAAASVGAAQCISVKKYRDGMYNKAFLMTMTDGPEVVAKVPNPNAGLPHLTTASEVATVDSARNIIDTLTPHGYAWNSHVKSSAVGAEYIIMEKMSGVPLSQVWDTMKLPQRLQVFLALTKLQTKWLNVSFSHYGSLHYTGDVQSPAGNFYNKGGKNIEDARFTIGPATGRDWVDAGRSELDIDGGLWSTLSGCLHAIGTRETKAVHLLKPPKQLALLCGPRLYQPESAQKLDSLSQYRQIINTLIPKNTAITNPHLWHNDLHDDNIFIDPNNPGKITGIIDWQSCHISPLFLHNPDPALLDWDGLEPDTLDLVPVPELTGLTPAESAAALREYTLTNGFVAWRKLMQGKNPNMNSVVEFRKTAAYGLIFLAHRMFEYGEAHFQSLLVDLKDTWADIAGDEAFPFDFSNAQIEWIKRDAEGAIAGTEMVSALKERLGDLWPDKGFVEHERYEECKAALQEVKEEVLEQLAETEEEKSEYENLWPFE